MKSIKKNIFHYLHIEYYFAPPMENASFGVKKLVPNFGARNARLANKRRPISIFILVCALKEAIKRHVRI